MLINTKLRERRKHLKLTMKEVADIVGVTEATISRWETGDISNMRRDRIALYAKALQTDPTFIMNMETKKELRSNIASVISQSKIHLIPVFDSVSAGFGAYAADNIVEYIPMVIENDYDVPDIIGLHVKGNSMYPKIEDGDTIVVRRQKSVDSGDVAVLLLDGEEGLVKKVVYNQTSIDLISINPEYQARHFENEEVERLDVVGKVIKVVKNL